jgi:tRNA pseudouridine13 synthase
MTIRRQPSDFVVRERPGPALGEALKAGTARRGPHALYVLEKTSLSTPEAISRAARALNVRMAEVAYAGLKDKHAVTVQHVTIPSSALRKGEAVASVDGQGFSLRHAGWLGGPIGAPEIEGNAFEIVVRDLSAQASGEMDRRARLLPGPGGALVVVNYFGAQRFGSARHGEGFIAAHLVKGEFEEALRLAIGTPSRKDTGVTRTLTRQLASRWGAWAALAESLPRCPQRRAVEYLGALKAPPTPADFREAFARLPYFEQQMSVEALQSYLWNATARRLVERLVAEAPPRPVGAHPGTPGPDAATQAPPLRLKPASALRTEDDYGPMLFPPADLVDEHWREVELPLLAPKTVLHEPWGPAAASVLEEVGLKLEDLKIPGMRRPFFGEAMRPLFVPAGGFAMDPAAPDDLTPGRTKRTLRFTLPRGAYATVVLRALGQ